MSNCTKVVELRSRGKSFGEIGKVLGFSRQRACQVYIEGLTGLDPLEASKRTYFASSKGKASQAKYLKSDKGKAALSRYAKSEKGKEAQKRYRLKKKRR